MRPQPMIAVRDVEAASAWYQRVLGLTSAHGGPEYEQLTHDGHLVMQLHDWDAHEHPELGSADAVVGNGVALWFETDAFDAVAARIAASGADVRLPEHVNPSARHREIWLRDLDGYLVVVASPYGDAAASVDDALVADAG